MKISRILRGAARRAAAVVAVSVAASMASMALGPTARADDVTEATVLFQRGNEHFQRAMRLRGERRTRELEAALAQYFESLRRVRSRNVLYNTALVLEALDRAPEAFNHWSEYLQVQGLSEAELADGRQHRDALRPRVAVFAVEANAEADVWVDRRDLGARGRTPLEIALPPGSHTFFLAAGGHREAQAQASGGLGTTTPVRVTLEVLPVWVQVLAPEGAILEIDGGRIAPGQSVQVPPGPHVVRVSSGGRLLAERRFEALVGAAPMVLDMTSALGGGAVGGVVEVSVSTAARVEIDGVVQGEGERVEATVSPGPHQVRVSAAGHATWEGTQLFQDFPARLEVTLAARSQAWIHVGRGIFGLLTVTALPFGIGFLVDASAKRDANQSLMDDPSAEALRTATLQTDVTWSVIAGLGGLAVLFLALDDGGGESTATLSVQPTAGGTTLSLRGSFGGAL
ncbi:MAG: hypothetical protein OHK0013_04820 [Sandaracinaceae bacterium]